MDYGSNWNVVLTYGNPGSTVKDAVVFGYAFRGHWFWSNPDTATGRAWLLWKDYNGNAPFTKILSAGVEFESLHENMADIDVFLGDSNNLDKTLLPDSVTANNWDNAVRMHDEITALFEGSYTIFMAEDAGQIEIAASAYSYFATPGPNYYVKRFIYGTRNMTMIIFGMSDVYGSVTKPTAPFMPSCLDGINNVSLPRCP